MSKSRIESLKKEIDAIKKFILMNKNTLTAKKSDVAKINERYKAAISRADSKEKAKLRERKAKDVDHVKKEMESVRRQILDKKNQIARKRLDISKLK
jgi:hypothetical protein